MKPFKIKNREGKSRITLAANDFSMKEFFCKMIESPDQMYSKLSQMLNKNSDKKLHAFIELGGLSKIHEWLNIFYKNNNQNELIKWLKILNHNNFPIDIELISTIGLGNFIIKQIKPKYNNMKPLTNSIEQKWYNFAKKEKEIHEKRNKNKHKNVSISNQHVQQITFKRNDRPSKIKQYLKNNNLYNNSNKTRIKSILRTSNSNINTYNNSNASGNDNFNTNLMIEDEIENHNEYTIEYIDDNDIDMDDSQNSHSDDNDSITHLFGNNDDIQTEIKWYLPIRMKNEYMNNNMNSLAMREEEQRIKRLEYNNGRKCIELNTAKIINRNINSSHGNVRRIPLDYAHWSEIQKYRRENES